MSDRIMGEEEIEEVSSMAAHWNSATRYDFLMYLCTSHRLLAERMKKLEAKISDWEDSV